jgi:large subunit ribosomal protein L30
MLTVRQVRSGIGYDRRQKATLDAMGLGRVGRERRLPDLPEVRAMVGRIPHLVVIVDDPRAPSAGRTAGAAKATQAAKAARAARGGGARS